MSSEQSSLFCGPTKKAGGTQWVKQRTWFSLGDKERSWVPTFPYFLVIHFATESLSLESLLRGTQDVTGGKWNGLSGQMALPAGPEALTSTVVTMSDLLVRESVTLGPRPLATSVILRPSAGLHTPTWMDRQTDKNRC